MPWEWEEDEDHAKEGHEGEDVALSVAGHYCYFAIDVCWRRLVVLVREKTECDEERCSEVFQTAEPTPSRSRESRQVVGELLRGSC